MTLAARSKHHSTSSGRLKVKSPAELAAQVQAVVDSRKVAGRPWPTGIGELDRAIGGGIPRGRLTEFTGPLAAGRSTLARLVAARALTAGRWVAWIDVTRTMAPASLAGLGDRLVVIRPPSPLRAPWVADLLLRSSVFSLVVIDGAPHLSRVHGLRLAQLAREHDAACIVLDHGISAADRIGHSGKSHVRANRLTGTVRLDISTHAGAGTIGMRITVEKGGAVSNRRLTIEVDRVSSMAYRLCAHPEVPDRRSVARSARRPWSSHKPEHTGRRHAATESGFATGSVSGTVLDPVSGATAQSVSGGGIGVVAHDLYGIGVPEPAHFAPPQRQRTDHIRARITTPTPEQTVSSLG